MKCFSASMNGASPGIVLGDKLDRLALHGKNGSLALLDEELQAAVKLQQKSETFEFSNARIMACDVDRRSETWLRPETALTKRHALVAFSCEFEHVKSQTLSNAGDSEIVSDLTFVKHNTTCFRMLLRIPMASTFRLATVVARSRFQRRLFRHTLVPFQEHFETTITYNADGKLKVVTNKREV